MILRRFSNVQPAYQWGIRLFSSSSVKSSKVPYEERKTKILDCEVNILETLGNEATALPILYLPGVFGKNLNEYHI